MAVQISRAVADVGLYVPFRGFDREVGPVGTLSVDAQITGSASGGAVTLVITMARVEFGFHPIWIPTRVASNDELNTPEVVEFVFSQAGNERLNADYREAQLAAAVAGGTNVAIFEALGVAIEPQEALATAVLTMIWSTNIDTDTYHMHVYGILYDGEALARGLRAGKGADQLLGGVR